MGEILSYYDLFKEMCSSESISAFNALFPEKEFSQDELDAMLVKNEPQELQIKPVVKQVDLNDSSKQDQPLKPNNAWFIGVTGTF